MKGDVTNVVGGCGLLLCLAQGGDIVFGEGDDAGGNVLCRCGYEWVGGGVEEEDMLMRGKLYGVV